MVLKQNVSQIAQIDEQERTVQERHKIHTRLVPVQKASRHTRFNLMGKKRQRKEEMERIHTEAVLVQNASCLAPDDEQRGTAQG